MHKLNYFNNKLSSGFVALFSGRMVQLVGQGLISIFLPVYLLTVFSMEVEKVFLFMVLAHTAYIFFLPYGARLINYVGLNNSLRISIFFVAAYYICLYFFQSDPMFYIPFGIVFLTLGRTFFWIPYHTDLAIFTNRRDRGKSIGLLWAASTLIGVIMPILSGWLISQFGYPVVFILAVIIYTSSFFSFIALTKTEEKYSWKYFETFKNFFDRKNSKMVLANMANGAENEVGIVIWPIFMWQLLDGNYFLVGALSSLIVVTTVFMELFVGKYTDIIDKRKLLHWGSMFYAVGWFAKIFVLSAFQIFVVGTYHNFAQIFKNTPFDTLNYELLADQGHYIDEFTVLKEIAVYLGKILILILSIFIALNFGLNWTFAIAALASLLVNLF